MSRSKTPNPFDIAGKLLDAQQAQLELAQSMMDAARDIQAWQRQALDVAQSFAAAQQQWLALWGFRR